MMTYNLLQTLLETGLLSRPIYEKLKFHPAAIYYLLTRKYMPPSDETDRVLVEDIELLCKAAAKGLMKNQETAFAVIKKTPLVASFYARMFMQKRWNDPKLEEQILLDPTEGPRYCQTFEITLTFEQFKTAMSRWNHHALVTPSFLSNHLFLYDDPKLLSLALEMNIPALVIVATRHNRRIPQLEAIPEFNSYSWLSDYLEHYKTYFGLQ